MWLRKLNEIKALKLTVEDGEIVQKFMELMTFLEYIETGVTKTKK